jgi:phenylacetate-coenzyme A ligase PaaK-like adenylate-forming protein
MNVGYQLKNLRDVARAMSMRSALLERERWPRERLETFQRARLAALVEYASEHSPFYRELYGGRVDGRDVRLEDLPSVTKASMMERFDDFVTDRRLHRDALERHLEATGTDDTLYLGEYRVMASSGSSGRKGIYVYDRRGWSEFLTGALRWTTMMGMTPRLPRWRMAQVAAPDVKHMTRRGQSSLNVGPMFSIALSASQPMPQLVAALERHRPHCLMGYPSILSLLAREQIEGRLRIAPKTVCTTSEVRTPEMTANIREAWGVEPYDCLGLTETGITASDCAEHRGLHVAEDMCILEVVDERGRPVPAGQPGEKVYATNLFNRTQPFIRFEVTDLLTMDEAPCACGRTLKRITAIEGRSDDMLDLPARAGGEVRVHPIHLRSPLAAASAVVQYQIVQTEDGLDVALVLAIGADARSAVADTARTLGEKLDALGVASLAIRVAVVDRIERESGAGKFKLIKALPRGAQQRSSAPNAVGSTSESSSDGSLPLHERAQPRSAAMR